MKYKRSELRGRYLKMPTLREGSREDGTLMIHYQQVNFRPNTNEQPARWYREDGTLREEWWYYPGGSVKRDIVYNPDGSVRREYT